LHSRTTPKFDLDTLNLSIAPTMIFQVAGIRKLHVSNARNVAPKRPIFQRFPVKDLMGVF
jgi:hypothetical protein